VSVDENVEIVQGLWSAFGRGDMAAVVAALAEDVEVTISGPPDVLPFAGAVRGRDEALSLLGRTAEGLEADVNEPREFIAQGDTVVVLGHERGWGRVTREPYEADWVQVYTLRGGRIAATREYGDTAAWVAAQRGRSTTSDRSVSP
jgi:ketosteroid isomerase-like protein